jgi:hypothetical protein
MRRQLLGTGKLSNFGYAPGNLNVSMREERNRYGGYFTGREASFGKKRTREPGKKGLNLNHTSGAGEKGCWGYRAL